MRRFLPILLLASSVSFAGQSTYFCSISNAYALDGSGDIEVWSLVDHLRKERFSIDRDTGHITAEFHTNSSPQVIWNPIPGDGNDYLVIDSAKTDVSGFTSSIVVNEYADSDRKPFL